MTVPAARPDGLHGGRGCEVETTNHTYLADYRDAVGPETGCILQVHPSNFRIEGFTAAVAVADLATLSDVFAPSPQRAYRHQPPRGSTHLGPKR